MAFYHEPNHQSTCKNLSLKLCGNNSNAQKFNALITNFGKTVCKHLNRFQIIHTDGNQCYWLVSICAGTRIKEGLFETTLRPKLVQAIEKLGWNKRFTWIPFYIEMANKLLKFKDDRKPLIDFIYNNLEKKSVDYINDENGNRMSDIVLDAKYKRLGCYDNVAKVNRDNIHQIIAYINALQASKGGFISPLEQKQKSIPTKHLKGCSSTLSIFGIEIARNATSYQDFCNQMKGMEEDFVKSLNL